MIVHTKRAAGVAALLAGGWLVSAAHATAIGVNFGAGGSNNITTGQSAGVVPQTGWNNVGGTTGTGVALYTDADTAHSATDASLTFSTDGNSGPSTGNSTPDYTLFNGNLDTHGVNNTSVAISGLGSEFTSGGYDVIVYFDGNNPQSRVAHFRVTPAGGSAMNLYGNDTANTKFSGTFIESTATSDPGTGAPDSNYVRFHNLTASSFTLLGIPDGSYTDVPRSPINGIQIVAVPEPASAGILGGLACLLAGRRRRR